MGDLLIVAFLISLCFSEPRKRYKEAWKIIRYGKRG